MDGGVNGLLVSCPECELLRYCTSRGGECTVCNAVEHSMSLGLAVGAVPRVLAPHLPFCFLPSFAGRVLPGRGAQTYVRPWYTPQLTHEVFSPAS